MSVKAGVAPDGAGGGVPPWPAGTGRLHRDEIGSTNAEALHLAPQATSPFWLTAGQQTSGRGRRARPWVSPRGNLYATLLLPDPGPPAVAALRSFTAALALRDALERTTGAGPALSLKWPNDVLLCGGKVAGILLESAGQGGRVPALAIGIGVNLISHPDPAAVEPGALAPVSVLSATGLRLSPEGLLDHLAPAFARWEALFVAHGFPPIREAWLSHAARLGEMIRARTGTTQHEGRFETVDPDGNLVLSTATGRLAIPAAEVFF